MLIKMRKRQAARGYKTVYAKFRLNPDDIFDIVDEIQAEYRSPRGLASTIHTAGYGNRLRIHAYEDRRAGIETVKLGELILGKDGSLSLKIYPHQKLLANPEGLMKIAKRHKV